MKNTFIALSALMLLSISAKAQRVIVDDFEELKVHYVTPSVEVTEGEYLLLSIGDYVPGGEVGAPMLPVSNNLISIPFCDSVTVQVCNAIFDTIMLPIGRVMPLQPSRSKSDAREARMIIDESVYTTDAFTSRPLASVTSLGLGRDRHYAVLSWSPVSVNPVSGQMVVCRSADVTVSYHGSDAGFSQKYYERYHSPAFSMGPTLNNLFSAKGIRTTSPIRMVVVAPQSLQCAALDEFADWKRRQGMVVDLVYQPTGTAASTTAATLQQMYDEASDAAPAPTYLVLVGDVAQLPPFQTDLTSSTVNLIQTYADFTPEHVTDLYFTTWTTGDKLPDCYQGRLSAADTNTLRNIIAKTIYYENYKFIDDSYLGRAALVAGYDNGYNSNLYDNAWRCSDPSMDYMAYYYVNADNGYNTVYYYKNDPSTVPEGVTVTGNSQSVAASSALRTCYNNGVGWINYSAHGDWDRWYRPTLTVSQINQMSNYDKPSFMIGNCCLTNKFDKGVCFGEALLRCSSRAGAVGYIGATNSTFWDEDFYWSVGVRSNINHTMTPSYDQTRKGMYDRLFHTHSEALADQVYTAGQLLNSGNASVQQAVGSSSWATAMAEYYWEIYELMGDPSLMPWLGTASTLTATVGLYDDRGICVYSVPGAYVAFVTEGDHRLQASAFADADGMACFDIDRDSLSASFVSITAQGYKPYIKSFRSHPLGIDEVADAAVTVSPNPATDRCTVSADGLQRVMVVDVTGQTMCVAEASADSVTLDLQAVPTGFYLLRIQTADGTCVKKLVVK